MQLNLPEKLYYNIGEISKAFDIKPSLLRFWEKEFKQIKPRIFSGKRRYYDQKNIETLRKIKFLLKEKGLTINGAKNS